MGAVVGRQDGGGEQFVVAVGRSWAERSGSSHTHAENRLARGLLLVVGGKGLGAIADAPPVLSRVPVTVCSRWLSDASSSVIPSARAVPHSDDRATLRRLPSRSRADHWPISANRSTSTVAPSTSVQNRSMSVAGIHGAPRRAVISVGSSWRGRTRSRAARFTVSSGRSWITVWQASSFWRMLPERYSPEAGRASRRLGLQRRGHRARLAAFLQYRCRAVRRPGRWRPPRTRRGRRLRLHRQCRHRGVRSVGRSPGR